MPLKMKFKKLCFSVPSFWDIGEGKTDETGICCVALYDVFLETVNTQVEYQVFLQKEGRGDIWIREKHPGYFVVEGTPGLKFAWEAKAKQDGFEYERL